VTAGTVRRPRRGAPAPGGRRLLQLGAGAGAAAAEGTAGWLHPLLGAVLAGADVLLPATFAGILLGAALFGGNQASERAFRLLRCITGRREPAPPPPAPTP
jgi:hypothetical protein